MNKERIDDLVDILGEEYDTIENTFVIRNNEQLAKYLDKPEQWANIQISGFRAYKKKLIKMARDKLAELNAKLEKVYLLTYQEVDKDIIEVTKTEVVVKKMPPELAEAIAKGKKFNQEQLTKLANETFKTYKHSVRILSQTKSGDELYDVVKRQMIKGTDNGIKVVYRDGKVFSWKHYMEMNIRTTVHQEANDLQIKAGAAVGQIFYMCNSFGDSAPDHADYQGKLYYNEDATIPADIMAFIQSNGIMSMQQVENNDPWLCQRPNCRHSMNAVPTDDVLNKSPDQILEDEGLKHGEYKDSNYELSQKQRYNERQIRKWKMRVENNNRIKKETGAESVLGDALAERKVKEWEQRNKELIQENKGVLKRQKEREQIGVVVHDLGVRYDYKVVDGELQKK